MRAALVTIDIADGVATVTLDRPERHNALIPELLEDLRWAIAEARKHDVFALVLAGAGQSFSTGGDIGGFLASCETSGGIGAYAERIVGLLNAAILDLLDFPFPVVARLNGPVTGGSIGLVLAGDIVLMSEAAFLQSYYVEVGFAPDGGWTAMLPERIGPARAVAIQALNRRIEAPEALALGLASEVVAEDALDAAVSRTIETLRTKERHSLSATRRLVWDEARRAAIAARLEAEKDTFCALVGRPDVANRMRAFVDRR
ncbi:enoyl-CoA hydratase/isomerase family protein [Microbaculum marinisediminis]|uniref:Enoyl-CoA hydratase/isomerase family protein n=1 Tax=Microbaculum marinisediminis TaxID=2931392 RepID=A0AAW5QXE9_9HYPH|nr:enoyl-CoA hydratase/isomerase family protein [Microbaculum sp. A6E488]MCT8972741.1 enoyl-CoA hydratase/isomerase family protein [Microbaculum sp. A6E488]